PGPPAGEQIQHRHSHRHTVRDLIENHAVWTIGDPRVDLDATVHRPRMHDRDAARRLLERLERHAEHAVILAHARNEPLLHALELEPQHIEDVGPFDRFLDAAEATHSQLLDATRHQGVGPADANLGAHFQQAPDVGPCHARVQHVADEADLQAVDFAVLVADGEEV